jgi:SAM-dependent methyltransferase
MTPEVHFARSPGEVHQRYLVPALFQPWTEKLLSAAGVRKGMYVADVACGTGAVTRAAGGRVGSQGLVAGIDSCESMLAVARNRTLRVDSGDAAFVWQQAPAHCLPFGDASFDAVVCQFGLMFFEQRTAAIREMFRILRPGGRMVLTVWDTVELCPGFCAELQLLRRICGPDIAAAFAVAYSLGEPTLLRSLFRQAGLARISITARESIVHFPSIHFWMFARIKGSALATRIGPAQYAQLLAAADRELAPFAARDGTVTFAAPGHVIVVNKPQ